MTADQTLRMMIGDLVVKIAVLEAENQALKALATKTPKRPAKVEPPA